MILERTIHQAVAYTSRTSPFSIKGWLLRHDRGREEAINYGVLFECFDIATVHSASLGRINEGARRPTRFLVGRNPGVVARSGSVGKIGEGARRSIHMGSGHTVEETAPGQGAEAFAHLLSSKHPIRFSI